MFFSGCCVLSSLVQFCDLEDGVRMFFFFFVLGQLMGLYTFSYRDIQQESTAEHCCCAVRECGIFLWGVVFL